MNENLCSTVGSNTPPVLRDIFHVALTHNLPEDQMGKGGTQKVLVSLGLVFSAMHVLNYSPKYQPFCSYPCATARPVCI